MGNSLLPRGLGLCTTWAGFPSAGEELVGPPLERGRRRGGLLIADEAVHNGGWDRGPASELGLERRHRGEILERGANPQELRLIVVLDRRIENLREERHQVG